MDRNSENNVIGMMASGARGGAWSLEALRVASGEPSRQPNGDAARTEGHRVML